VQVSGGAVGEVRLCVFVGVLPSVPRASSPISSAAVPALAAAAAGPRTGVRSGNDIPMITELGQSVLCQLSLASLRGRLIEYQLRLG